MEIIYKESISVFSHSIFIRTLMIFYLLHHLKDKKKQTKAKVT